jgi:hypothetical protein
MKEKVEKRMKLLSKKYCFMLFTGFFLLQQECYATRAEFVDALNKVASELHITDQDLINLIPRAIDTFFIDPLKDNSPFFTMKAPSLIEVPRWHLLKRSRQGAIELVAAKGPSVYLLHAIQYAIVETIKKNEQDQHYFIDPVKSYSDNPEDYQQCQEQDDKSQTIVDYIQPFFTNLSGYAKLPISNDNEKRVKKIITTVFEHIAALLTDSCWNKLQEKLIADDNQFHANLNQFWLIRAGGTLRKYCYYLKKTDWFKRKWQDITRSGQTRSALFELVRAMIKLQSLSSPTKKSHPLKRFVAELTEKINLYVFNGDNKEEAQGRADYIIRQVESYLSFFWHQHRIKMLSLIGLGGIAGFLFYKYKYKKLPEIRTMPSITPPDVSPEITPPITTEPSIIAPGVQKEGDPFLDFLIDEY